MARCLVAMWLIVLTGCEVRDTASESYFEEPDTEFVLMIAIDADYIQSKSAPFEFMKYAIESYFRERVGSNDQLILCQLSGSDSPVIWQGSPHSLLREFQSADQLGSFLKSHAKSGSRINLGLSESIDFVLNTRSVASGKSKVVTLVLSDMVDDQPMSETTDRRLMNSLTSLARRGGMGLYFVDQRRMKDIRENMEKAGFRFYNLECDVFGRPPLPRFE